MSDDANTDSAAPLVDPTGLTEIAAGVFVIPDNRVPLVPNIGIIRGEHSALVVDCGMGPVNGETVLAAAKRVAGDRDLILTLTHFHPEHGFGAQAFSAGAETFYNAAQANELAAKGKAYLEMFRDFGPSVASALEGTKLVQPDRTWTGDSHTLDLGGRKVELRTWGKAHTQADQVVWLPQERILFTGDLAENRIFPIFPWFPPDDVDISAVRWCEALADMEAMRPAVVVPGHGELGGVEILQEVRRYLEEIARRVAVLHGQGVGTEAMVEQITTQMTSDHPDWDAPEWIGFAVRYHADNR